MHAGRRLRLDAAAGEVSCCAAPVPHPVDDLHQLTRNGLDDEVDREAVVDAILGVSPVFGLADPIPERLELGRQTAGLTAGLVLSLPAPPTARCATRSNCPSTCPARRYLAPGERTRTIHLPQMVRRQALCKVIGSNFAGSRVNRHLTPGSDSTSPDSKESWWKP
jgi:hypothetical protein